MKPPPIVRGRLWSKRRGEVSELAFFCKAASLGFGVAKPWGDTERYDFTLEVRLGKGGPAFRVLRWLGQFG